MSRNYQEWQVTVPEASKGPWTIEQFEIPEGNIHAFLLSMKGRDPGSGTFTRLLHKRRGLVMSDTHAEIRDHFEPAGEIKYKGGRILINGLGLGMFAAYCLRQENVEHVDIVEIDEDIISLVEPHLRESFPHKSFSILQEDAFVQMKKWETGMRWNVAWHDIWDTICGDDRPEHARLMRSYGCRVDWQACWGRATLDAFNIR